MVKLKKRRPSGDTARTPKHRRRAQPAGAGPAGEGALPHAGEHRLCKKCGQVNDANAEACTSCGSKRLAPSWVLDRRAITKQFEVQITESSKEFGDPEARI